MPRPIVLAALPALIVACGGGAAGAPPVAPAAASLTAAAPTLADVEAALLGAQAWRVEVTIHAEGVFPAELTATVLATRDNRARIDARGTFAGNPVTVHWVSDGTRTSAGAAAPAHTTEAIIIGMTRMGLLHNVARLVGGEAAPDHADGGVTGWVVATAATPAGDGQLDYGLTVDGKDVATVTLAVAPGANGPVMTRRRIAVRFDGGTMTVDETYAFDLAVELPSDAFVVGGGP